MIKHKCTAEKEDTVLKGLSWYRRVTLVSADNPRRLSYFRSDVSIREERRRHLEVNKRVIHPFSTFRGWYELFLVYLYGSVLITKPFDAGFVNSKFAPIHPFYRFYTIFTDILCWADIVISFMTGYEVPMNRMVELRTRYIAKHYILGPFFFFDVISSIPKVAMYYLPSSNVRRRLTGVISIMGICKIVRLGSLIKNIHRSCEYFLVKSKGRLFLFSTTIVFFMVVHVMGCLEFFIPKLIRYTFNIPSEIKSWYIRRNLHQKRTFVQYVVSCFKSSAYILGIRMNICKPGLPEEYILSIFTYFLGKILIGFIWIILAVAILNSRLMEIKFEEMINQLEEYMKQKQLPLNLRGKILQYFNFKYRNKYFKENLINTLLSENLRNEANLHVCKSLIKNVTLFSDLNPAQLKKVVDCLILEIFMPNDIIIHAGSYGDAMYFLFSGTVAVYSRTGKEICHLQDGAYFGEVSLLLKGELRSTTVVALETSQIYRLKKNDFDKCLMANKEVKAKMLKYAEFRLKESTRLDEEYKEKLFEESFRGIPRNSKA